ncbi:MULTISPECIES: hypothetical protein [Saliphagus]|uniref:Uncharacterized protein n=1 Tax=Saliphagus infecundisoli TaxID=1849069 RepID=A0ABD5QJT0_9EURY|nr:MULTISPECIES: hypothetical protein [Saliphagus]
MTDDSETGTIGSIDVDHPERVGVGVTRGETERSIGRPRDYPDRADLSVGTVEGRIGLTVDTMAGDHGTGHADVELTVGEARELRELLEEALESVEE